MSVVDIALVPVPRASRDAYAAFAARMAEVYRDHGATEVTDYWQSGPAAEPADFHGDGAEYEPGELRTLGQALGAGDDEAVAVTVTVWPSEEARDRGTAAVAADPRVTATLDEPPVFDGARVVGERFERLPT